MWPLEPAGTRWVTCFQLSALSSCLLQQTPLLFSPHLTISILRAHCWQVDTIGHPRRFHSAQFHLFWHRDARPRISTFPDSTTQYAANFYSVSIEIDQITRESACALKWYISSMCRVRNLNMANNVLLVGFFLVAHDRPHSSVNRVIAVMNVLLRWA